MHTQVFFAKEAELTFFYARTWGSGESIAVQGRTVPNATIEDIVATIVVMAGQGNEACSAWLTHTNNPEFIHPFDLS